MKVKKIQPVISDVVVIIEDVRYEETTCSIEVSCHCSSLSDAKNNIFTPLYASCEEPYFVIGGGLWEENFGKRQSNNIKKICAKAIKEYLAKEDVV